MLHVKLAGESGAIIGAERTEDVAADEEEEDSALLIVELAV